MSSLAGVGHVAGAARYIDDYPNRSRIMCVGMYECRLGVPRLGILVTVV